MRELLLVAYYYAPAEHAGTRRAAAFAKYLPAAGYLPVVLTTSLRGRLASDAEQRIVRADELLGLLTRPYRALRLRGVPDEQRANAAAFAATGRLTRLLMAVMVPDRHISWHPLAVRRGLQVIRERPIALLFSTSPPPTGHLVALSLKRRTGLPWVADFRDGWMYEPPNPVTLNSPLRRRLEATLERRVVLGADRIVTVNAAIAKDLARRYPAAAGKLAVITNGYDPADFAGLTPPPAPPGRLRLVHTGALTLSRADTSIAGLLAALRGLRASAPALAREIELVLVGQLAPAEQALLAEAGLAEQLTLVGPVAHRDALSQQAGADVLLLVTVPGESSVTTSKLFEYLASGRPILGLTGRSPAAELIAALDAGVVVPPDDVPGITAALRALHARWRAGDLPTRSDSRVERFSRPRLAADLARICDELLAPR